jgi:short-subunit dehydrogenase
MKKLGDTYQTALVTGGTSGLGLAFCKMLVEEGVETFSASRQPSKLPSLSGLHGLKIDLSDLPALSSFANQFIEDHGVPDLLINNAGYGAFFEWGDFPEEEIAGQIGVMLQAPALLCRIFAPQMEKRGKGGIINVSSLAVQYPLPYFSMYNAAKAGLSALSASLIIEYHRQAPFVIDFRPGDFCTSFNEASKRDSLESGDAVSTIWKTMDRRLSQAKSPVQAARKLRAALIRGKSGIIYAGDFLQAGLGPAFHRLLPHRCLVSFLRYYHGFKPSTWFK